MFLVGNEIIMQCEFPSREGIKGCVTVKDAAKVEVFLLLFGEMLSVRFWVTALGLGGCVTPVHRHLKTKATTKAQQIPPLNTKHLDKHF